MGAVNRVPKRSFSSGRIYKIALLTSKAHETQYEYIPARIEMVRARTCVKQHDLRSICDANAPCVPSFQCAQFSLRTYQGRKGCAPGYGLETRVNTVSVAFPTWRAQGNPRWKPARDSFFGKSSAADDQLEKKNKMGKTSYEMTGGNKNMAI